MKHLLPLFFIAFVILSCSTVTEEDKYPEMPLLKEVLSEYYTIDTIKSVAKYYNTTHTNFDLFLNDKTWDLFIYEPESKKLVQQITVDRNFNIAENGSIYYVLENDTGSEFKGYELKPPYVMPPIELDLLVLDGRISYHAISNIYHEEIVTKGIEPNSVEMTSYVSKKITEYLTDSIANQLDCVFQISFDEGYRILFFKNGDKKIVNDSYHFYSETSNTTTLRHAEMKIPICPNNILRNNPEEFLPSNCKLSLLDEVTLDYHVQGSNHFAIGLTPEKLYYYELTIDGKVTSFKTSEIVNPVYTVNNDPIFSFGENYFSIKAN